MSTPNDALTLAHWRRTVAEMYASVRRSPPAERTHACDAFRAARDDLFRSHPQSPLVAEQRAGFSGLGYYPYDPAWRVVGTPDKGVEQDTLAVELPAEGTLHYTRIARVRFVVWDQQCALSLFWIEGYGGGLFLPFGDATNGQSTYGGGRYLYDTIKGADLGAAGDAIVLDFNYAYNPSCAYNPHWVCPLSPRENRLSLPVPAGEKVPVV
jgi:uncharacterized protein (DUF1684 family)